MKHKIPTKQKYDAITKTWVLIPAPDKGKCIKLLDDGIHYEIIESNEG